MAKRRISARAGIETYVVIEPVDEVVHVRRAPVDGLHPDEATVALDDLDIAALLAG